MNKSTLEKLALFKPLEPHFADVRKGLRTGDNFRFVRASWEIPFCEITPDAKVSDSKLERGRLGWVPLVIGGTSQPWYSPITSFVKWHKNAVELRDYVKKYGTESRLIQAEDHYFMPGFSWTLRSTRFIPYIIPSGCIPTGSRPMAFPLAGIDPASVLFISASNVSSAFQRFYGEKFLWPKFLEGSLKLLPITESKRILELSDIVVSRQVAQRRRAYQNHEPFHDFVAPTWLYPSLETNALAYDQSSILGNDIELEVANAYGLSPDEYEALTCDLREAVAMNAGGSVVGDGSSEAIVESEEADSEDGDDDVLQDTAAKRAEALVSYAVGIVFGRWDVRMATDHSLIPAMAGPFDHLPVCPPGALVGPDALPATSGTIVSPAWLKARPDAITLPPAGSVAQPTIPDAAYPVRVAWSGLVVDDYDDLRQSAHPDDLTHRIEQVFAVLFGKDAPAQEAAVCQALELKSLREYLHKPTNFWKAHVDRYSKSRRKAPIYWFLQSEKKTFGLWLYFHRLDGDLIKKAIVQYVEPKLKQEESTFTDLRLRYEEVREAGGRPARQAEVAMNDQKSRVDDLANFLDELRRIAGLNLVPDLNDGVLLNIAPFHAVVPWKDATTAWNDLLKGKYPWSAIGKQLAAQPQGAAATAAPAKSRAGRKAKN